MRIITGREGSTVTAFSRPEICEQPGGRQKFVALLRKLEYYVKDKVNWAACFHALHYGILLAYAIKWE